MKKSFFRKFFLNSQDAGEMNFEIFETLLSDARYHNKTKDGMEYVSVLPSSRTMENGIVSGHVIPENPDA